MKKSYSFSLYFTLFFVGWVIRATWFYAAVDLSIADETARLAFSLFVKFLLWVVPPVALLVWFERENPWEKLRVTTSIVPRDAAVAALASLVYFVLVFLVEYLASGRTLRPLLQSTPAQVFGGLAAVSVSPVIEELLFRGYVLYKLNASMKFWQANALQAALFTAMHLPNWIWSQGVHAQIAITAGGVFILALLLGWICRKTNSIWPPVVVHILNNFLASFLR